MSPALALREKFSDDVGTAPQQQADIIQLHPAAPATPTEQEIVWQKEAEKCADKLGYIGDKKSLVRSQFIAQFMMAKTATPSEERSAYIGQQQAIKHHYEEEHCHQASLQERGGVNGMFASYKNLLYIPN